MASTSTKISWTDSSWNPIRGCSKVSPGCKNCYAERIAARFSKPGQPYHGLAQLGVRTGHHPKWTGVVKLFPEQLADPLRWKKPRRVFVNSMSDLFHENLTNEQIAAVFGVMAAAPRHTFQVLTKRAERMRDWFRWAIDGTARNGFYDATFLNHITSKAGLRWEDCPRWLSHCEETEDTCASWPLPNVWMGVSVENQAAADERIPLLLETPAAVRFLSCEPLLERVNAFRVWRADGRNVDWLIAGCESGPGARPCDVDWLRSLRDQCKAAGVPFFLKQAVHGAVFTAGPGNGHSGVMADRGSHLKAGGVIELPYLDGVQHAAFPEVRA